MLPGKKTQLGTLWSIQEIMDAAAILTFSGFVVSENMIEMLLLGVHLAATGMKQRALLELWRTSRALTI